MTQIVPVQDSALTVVKNDKYSRRGDESSSEDEIVSAYDNVWKAISKIEKQGSYASQYREISQERLSKIRFGIRLTS